MLPLPNGHQVPAKKLVPVQWPALNAFPELIFLPQQIPKLFVKILFTEERDKPQVSTYICP